MANIITLQVVPLNASASNILKCMLEVVFCDSVQQGLRLCLEDLNVKVEFFHFHLQ
jgi:hypothetical protein